MIPVQDWVQLKAAQAQGQQVNQVEWSSVLEGVNRSFKSADVDLAVLKLVFLNCETPDKFTVMIRLFYQYARTQAQGKKGFSLFMGYVDSSPFPLVQWIEALCHFYDWMIDQKRKIDFARMLGYLECCSNAKETPEIHRSLLSVLQEMLERWGVEERK